MAAVTQAQIAKSLNVSRATVSQVLSGFPKARISPEVRKQVLEAAERLKYFPNQSARRLRAGRTGLIGVISFQGGTSHSYSKTEAIIRTLIKKKWEPLSMESFWFRGEGGDEGLLTCQRMIDARVEGIVLIEPSQLFKQEYLELLRKMRIPVVSIGGGHLEEITVFESDRKWGYQTLAMHLLALGHRQLALLGSKLLPSAVGTTINLYSAEHKITIPPPHVLPLASAEQPQTYATRISTYEGGRLAMEALLKEHERPDAVLCNNDEVALGALSVCSEANTKVPEEMAMVGFDDILPARYGTIPLTTIRYPYQEIATLAVASLLKQIETGKGSSQPSQPSHITRIPGELIIRKSCGSHLQST